MATRGGNQSDAHSALIKAVVDYIWGAKGYPYKVWGGPFARPGVPDVLSCVRGRMVAVEAKTGHAVLSAKQKYERDRLLAAGALYVECRCPEDLERALLTAGLIDAPMLTSRMEFTPERAS